MNVSCSSEPLLEYTSCASLYILQCVLPAVVAVEIATWFQINSWIFVIIAIAAAAVVVAIAWWGDMGAQCPDSVAVVSTSANALF